MGNRIGGVILAGGRSSRMGDAHKMQVMLAGQPLLEHVIRRFKPQVDQLVINVPVGFQGIESPDCPVISDRVEGYQGPLMGLWSAMSSDELADADYIAVAPCDGPFLPLTLVHNLCQQIEGQKSEVAVIRYGKHIQPMFSLWHRRSMYTIADELFVKKQGGFKPLLQAFNTVELIWPIEEINPFFNINTPEDLVEAEALICR